MAGSWYEEAPCSGDANAGDARRERGIPLSMGLTHFVLGRVSRKRPHPYQQSAA
jgi:hypothetical protein